MVTAHFRQEHNTHTETGKSIYKALTLCGKQLLLKRDQSRSHKSNVYHKRRKFPGIKLSWFFNRRSEVKFRGFRGSLAVACHKVKWRYFNHESAICWED